MTRTELFDKLQLVLMDQLGVSRDEVESEASLAEDLGADSLDAVEIVLALEEDFDLEISDEDAATLTTVGKTFDYLVEKLGVEE